MAAPAKPDPMEEQEWRPPAVQLALPQSAQSPDKWHEMKKVAARLYGLGFTRSQIAKTLVEFLGTSGLTKDQRLKRARARLRKWEEKKEFRDMVYDQAIVKTDMAIPGILEGVVRKGRRGRVDAARLALEVTDRHNPRGNEATANVVVQIANVPRPKE